MCCKCLNCSVKFPKDYSKQVVDREGRVFCSKKCKEEYITNEMSDWLDI